jgi:hypothetical protein
MDWRGLRLALMAAMRSTPSISLATTGPKRWLTAAIDLPFAHAAVETAATSESWSS